MIDLGLVDGGAVATLLDALSTRGVGVMIYTGGDVPQALLEQPDLQVVRKPAPAQVLQRHLAEVLRFSGAIVSRSL